MTGELKKSLKQTVFLIVGAVLLIACMGLTSGGLGGFFQVILWAFGLTVGIAVAISVMIGIFFAMVAMTDPKTAATLWGDVKRQLGIA